LQLAQSSDLSLGDSKTWRQLFIQWTAEAQCDGSFLPDENRILYWYLYGSQTYLLDNDLRTLYNAAKSVSKPDAYFVNVIGGLAEIDDAWADRGSKVASEVTEEGWKGFNKHIAIGRKLFTEAWKLNPSYPEAPSGMITIAMAGADESEPRLWFDRTVAAQIDYGDAYYRYEYAILPRWGGSIKKLNDFGIECLKTKRYDTWVPWRYLRILSVIRKESDEDKTCWTTPEAIKHLDEMFDGYEKSGIYNRIDPNFFPSLRAATAWYCGRYDEAKKLCDALGDKLNVTLFQNFYSTPYETAKADMKKGNASSKLK